MLSKDIEFRYCNCSNIGYIKYFISRVFNCINCNMYTIHYDKEGIFQMFNNKIFNSFCNNQEQEGTLIKKPHFIDNVITQYSCEMESILVLIVKQHYGEIIDNIEDYILHCKTEKINIDFDKVDKFIDFIKEYVKSIYGFKLA